MKKICSIIPTIRDYPVIRKYAESGGGKSFFLLIAEDFCDLKKMRTDLKDWGLDGDIFGKSDRDEWMEENGVGGFKDIIPKRSHAETSFGLLWMLTHKEFEYGFFIDDDTEPIDKSFFDSHIKNLNFSGKIREISSSNRWVNVLFENFNRHKFYPRGYPYSAMNERVDINITPANSVVASQGLWTNVADLDALRILMAGGLDGTPPTRTETGDFKENFVVSKENCLTICSMNLAFKREIIPGFYQLPMDDNDWKLGRFDDIWSGVILKKIADVLGKSIITGNPLCIHNKSPRSTFRDLLAEAPALELNEHLWSILGDMKLKGDSYFSLYYEIAKHFQEGKWDYKNGEFLNFMGKMMVRWTECVNKLS